MESAHPVNPPAHDPRVVVRRDLYMDVPGFSRPVCVPYFDRVERYMGVGPPAQTDGYGLPRISTE